MLSADAGLAKRLEAAEANVAARWAQAHASLYPQVGAQALPVSGGYAVYAGIGSPLNQALGLCLQGRPEPSALDVLEAFYQARSVIPSVDVCPFAEPSFLELLGRRGYRVFEFMNALVSPIGGHDSLAPRDARIDLRKVGAAEVEIWARTVCRGFKDGAEPTETDLQVAMPVWHIADSAAFLAWADGKPVGGGAVMMSEGVAAFHSDSTIPEYRAQGVQTALIRARLAYAASNGCDLACAFTDPGSPSQRNYERHGFSVAYTKVRLRKG